MTGLPVPPHIEAIERPREALMKWYVIKALTTMIAFPVTVVILYFRYHTMRYRFDAEGIHMSWGILFQHQIMLNYSRIQDIHLHSNFVERWLGLARIEIETAAGGSNTEMTLEGLEDAEGMRDFLYSRMRGAHEHDHAAQPNTVPGSGGLASVLGEVATEMRAIRQLLEQRRG